jgi:hypothetical protein
MPDQISISDRILSCFETGYIGKSIEVGTFHNYLTFDLEEKFWKSYSIISDFNSYSNVTKGRRLVLNLDCSSDDQNLDYVLKYSNITPLDLLIIDDPENQFKILKGINLLENKPKLIGIKDLRENQGIEEHLGKFGLFPDFGASGISFFTPNGFNPFKNKDLESIFLINY